MNTNLFNTYEKKKHALYKQDKLFRFINSKSQDIGSVNMNKLFKFCIHCDKGSLYGSKQTILQACNINYIYKPNEIENREIRMYQTENLWYISRLLPR